MAEGKWDNAIHSIDFTETYQFDDGHKDTLRRTIRKLDVGKYSGAEPTLQGEAEGEQAGCAFHWKYTRDTPQKDRTVTRLNFDDWFDPINERVCIVRGSSGRTGIPFATAHVTYRKL